MAKVTIYRLDGEYGGVQRPEFFPTSRKASEAFDAMIADGIEPDGVTRVEVEVTRAGLAAFLNGLVEELDAPAADEDDD